MKKFISEYKAHRSKSEIETSKDRNKVDSPPEMGVFKWLRRNKVDSPPEMGVFKWLRRERVTVTTHSISSDVVPLEQQSQSATQVGTIRTEEYKRDLAEFQARRSSEHKETPELPITPVKKKCGRHSLPCTNCASANDTLRYDKKSKHKKKSHKRAHSAAADQRLQEGVPNIQFLFQNQVFMPGNVCPAYSEPVRVRGPSRRAHRSPDFKVHKHIDFNEEQLPSPPLFFKNNSLPFDVGNFLEGSRSDGEEVDGVPKVSSHSSGEALNKADVSDEKLWEVMSELNNLDRWADEQLQWQNGSKSDDSKSDASAYGLPIASASDLNMAGDSTEIWRHGRWGVLPVQMKKLTGVSIDTVKKKANTEINILRKCRHPNIILLMGLYPDVQNNVHIICEQCVGSLHGILHIQGRILSAQTSVHYALDIASALVFLRMQGYILTELTSHGVMLTARDQAKLADLGSCVRLPKQKQHLPKSYDVYSPEPQYVNISETRESVTTDSEPLISKHPSETYLASNSVPIEYQSYRESELYRWHAPELFLPDERGLVHPCVKSNVYSLSLILWESCNAAMPWKTHTYEKLKEQYTLWNTGIPLPQDGTYPGGLLALLQSGLKLARSERIDLTDLHSTLYNVKSKLDDLEYILIPARISKKRSNFSSAGWETNSPTDDSESFSPVAQNIQHKAVIHTNIDSSPDTSERETKSVSPMYETIRQDNYSDIAPQKCYVSDEDGTEERLILKYQLLPEREVSSACSTPIAKIRAKLKDSGTPNALHRSDSTEYCSFFSPENRHFTFNDSYKENSKRSTAKLSKSFTPKSYKPLHIKVPEFNLDCVKSILKENSGSEPPSYNFDIKNYSLPSTPIARSNKLRKNAWLSGDLSAVERSAGKLKSLKANSKESIEPKRIQSAPETPAPLNQSVEKEQNGDSCTSKSAEERSPGSDCMERDTFTGLKRVEPRDPSPLRRERANSWSSRPIECPSAVAKYQVEEDVLATVNVKPLVAIHERWIYEANRKTGRSMSLPEDNRSTSSAVKPASHCVDPLQKSLPQLSLKRAAKFRPHPVSPGGKSGGNWEQFCQAREMVAKSINLGARDPERFHTWRKDTEKGTKTTDPSTESKADQATDTRSIEEFIRELIRKEFQHMLHEISDDTSSYSVQRSEELLNRGVANIVENLKNGEGERNGEGEKNSVKSFSRVKINGNSKPLLQITFSRSGENSLQVLDNCVNVTICDNNSSGKEKFNVSMEKFNVSTEDTLTGDDIQVHSLKRCQAFNAIQEARSTEDLYIDDELSTQMQENFGGRVKLIPLHGSLHEILCEREDDCCLLKVKQENGCDTIYFRCDNSDTESRDAIDGLPEGRNKDTVVYKRSISLVEERIQRVIPKEKRSQTPTTRRKNQKVETVIKARPKSEVLTPKICNETRFLSSSSPSLIMADKNDEVEVNIENVMSYQDSSDEECVHCQTDSDDFELLEQKIEEDLANSLTSNLTCGCLEKISEENLSAYEEVDKE